MERREPARRDNEREGRELVTARAAARLFGITSASVRQARAAGRVQTEYVLEVAGGVEPPLIQLTDALECWKRRTLADLDDRVEAMRTDCHIFGDRGSTWNILHPDKVADSLGLAHLLTD